MYTKHILIIFNFTKTALILYMIWSRLTRIDQSTLCIKVYSIFSGFFFLFLQWLIKTKTKNRKIPHSLVGLGAYYEIECQILNKYPNALSRFRSDIKILFFKKKLFVIGANFLVTQVRVKIFFSKLVLRRININ